MFIDTHTHIYLKDFMEDRNEIIQGTCSPVIFTFQDLNLNPKNGCQ